MGRILGQAAAWLVTALLALLVLGQPTGWASPAGQAALELRGDVTGLVPGGTGTLTITVDNPASAAATVRRLSASVTDDDGCLTVVPWSGSLSVPPSGRAQADLAVQVQAERRCAGRSWTLVYAAA